MSFALSIVAFLLALIAIILIHEFGHYLVARAFGFRVLEYFVGFGPRLWSTRKGEIDYGVKAIPAGGYVKIAGMNPFVDDVPPGDEHRAYYAKPIWQRTLVILAGPLSHVLVALLIFSTLWWVQGEARDRPRRIDYVAPTLNDVTSPAVAAGLRVGDVILRLGELENPSGAEIGPYLSDHVGEPVEVTVRRGEQTLTVRAVPVSDVVDGKRIGRLGVLVGPVIFDPIGPVHAVRLGAVDVWDTATFQAGEVGRVFGPSGIGRIATLLFTDAPRTQGDPSSLYGISQQIGHIGEEGRWVDLFYSFAYVTLFIGLLNLLPLPPFDGGHLAVLVVEKIRGRKVDPRAMVPVSAAVLSFFALFTMAAVVLDVWKPIPSGP